MILPDIPQNENERLADLTSYHILDTLPEEDYNAITKLASEICGTPISLITLIDKDRQWFKSKYGVDAQETPRDYAFCAHAIVNPSEALIVPDSKKDDRFKDNPLVTGPSKLSFYAGIPLVTKAGHAIGSLCVIDNKPRNIAPEKIETLRLLAKQAVNLLELRKTVATLEKTKRELEQSFDTLDDFAQIVAHDIKAPVRNMGLLAEAIQEDYGSLLDQDGNYHLKLLTDNARDAASYIDGVLKYSKASSNIPATLDLIDLNDFFKTTLRTLQAPSHIKVEIGSNLPKIRASKIALQQVVTNLLSNAIKYNDKEEGVIQINASVQNEKCHIEVADNGRGIPQKLLDKVFTIFFMVHKEEAQSKGSSGIGLAIVKKVVEKMKGEIMVESEMGKGSQFNLILPA